jgi:hemolysin activation/secretion protein
VRFSLAGFGAGLTVRGGTSVGDTVSQMLFRVGGPETVRGYDYGTRAGRSVWAGQLDLALNRSGLVSPVVFADVGNTTFSGRPLSAVGGGISLFGGFVRFNLSKGLTPRTSLRFDLLFRTAR